MQKKFLFIPVLCAVLGYAAAVSSCKRHCTPKPKAYMRIDFPEKEYAVFNGSKTYPFSFKKAVYTQAVPVEKHETGMAGSWLDLQTPSLNAVVYLSYVARPDLDSCITNTLFFVQRHMGKATGVDEWEINRPQDKCYGWLYYIKGRDVASPYQFYLTDSSRHFVRGSLYINCTPNNDSLAPVLKFLKTDIDTLISSWKFL